MVMLARIGPCKNQLNIAGVVNLAVQRDFGLIAVMFNMVVYAE